MFKKPNELRIPPGVHSDAEAVELIRVWAAHGLQHVALAPEVWPDPGTWGLLFADLARHVANHYSQEHGLCEDEVLERIKVFLDADWAGPGAQAGGAVVN